MQHEWWLLMFPEALYAFFFGITGIFAPCAFVVIPILATQVDGKLKDVFLFLFGLFSAFLILGVLFGITGKLITIFFGDYIYLIAALFTLLMSLQLFGIIKIKILFFSFSHTYKHPLLSGLLFGLVVLCCVGPSLAAALAIILLNPTIPYSLFIMGIYGLGFLFPFIFLGMFFNSRKIHQSIVKNHKIINRASAYLMLIVSLYLFYVLFRGLTS